jgi:hypothetical protein
MKDTMGGKRTALFDRSSAVRTEYGELARTGVGVRVGHGRVGFVEAELDQIELA